ncbi:CheR family methyltransferase [Bermanella sp. WJH001]|uniref:CheR family methyltransferase n=1 Tax=Bermanella sp. WJH001 TaxID=3048005 RepID=UPI0024BDA584|nr:protein-glutamate O-methyltransferase CheR [Bermanella sp. WJH001]MDJ1539820.1 protein-glutamate O-methyltransferase CheR [Bermanella sp. WJH001]
MADEDFKRLSAKAYEISGIVLGDQKKELVYSRISRRIRKLGLKNFSEYCQHLEANHTAEVNEFVNSITTNLTSFFRESHHFEYLAKEIIPHWKKQNKSIPIRIWSSACSTGPEPYSIAITLHKNMMVKQHNIKILATDLDSDVLKKGREGIYPLTEIEQLPKDYLSCFQQNATTGMGMVKPEIKEMIQFNRLNLLGPWPMNAKFDVIFCRNVVIYFNKETQKELFERLADQLNDGGYLFIGHSETLHGMTSRFESKGRTIYKKIR